MRHLSLGERTVASCTALLKLHAQLDDLTQTEEKLQLDNPNTFERTHFHAYTYLKYSKKPTISETNRVTSRKIKPEKRNKLINSHMQQAQHAERLLKWSHKPIRSQDNPQMKRYTRCLYFILIILLWPAAVAQTDYIHFMNDRGPDKFVVSLTMNSQSYRELPGSPYACEVSDIDQNVNFQSSIHFTTPGKYTYFSRFRPDQLYGFRRMLDGNLQPLSGFPINIPSIQDPVFGRGGIISLEKHPFLPLFYSIHARDDVIRTWLVQENGELLEHPESPFRILGDGLVGIQGFEMTDDATTFYLNTIFEGVIFKGTANPKTGVLESYDVIYNHLEDGREILLSEDECYLYTTQFLSPVIGRYRIEDNGLTRLYPDFIAEHDVVWLWRKDDLIVSGATNERLASTFLIQDDGSLIAGANSPFDVFSNTLWYAGFSPSQDRVYFGGNTFLQVYDIGPQGRMNLAPNSGLPIDGLALGLSVAPEVRGDPYSLSFIQPQNPEEPFRIQGDPQTVFYLRVDDSCEGPYITDEAGFFETDYPRVPDQQLEILAYCDEAQAADTVFTVPTLNHYTLILFSILLLIISLQRNRQIKRRNHAS